MTASRGPRIKICWPNPDPVCLQGGCVYCRDSNYVLISELREYARGRGPKYVGSLSYAEKRGFPNQSARGIR